MLRGVRARLPGALTVPRATRQPRPSRTFDDVLADPRSYERQMDRLLDRHAMGRGMHELRQGEVSLA